MALTGGWPILAWARTAVAPRGGALARCLPHELAVPLVRQLLAVSEMPTQAIDTLVLGNALGANGNPARMLALAAGIAQQARALSVDTQCCSGMDAVTLACALLAAGQADVVIAGGAESWSRAPIRQHRPLDPARMPTAYERPSFAPDPAQDPDPLDAAATGAAELGITREAQDAYTALSHARSRAADPSAEIVAVAGCARDGYPRALTLARMARMPVLREARDADGNDCSLSRASVSPQADGAALLLLASPAACRKWGLRPRAAWLDAYSQGGQPRQPMLCAQQAARVLLERRGLRTCELGAIELHDAFAVQGLAFARALGLAPEALNPQGGGLARGHPIGASGAIALVRALEDWQRQPRQPVLAAIAAAGGLGSATLVGAWHG